MFLFMSPHSYVQKFMFRLLPDSVTLHSGLMLLHQILNHIPAFLTCLFPAPEEPLEKFETAAPSSERCTVLPYDLSAFKAAGAHQFSC